MTRCDVCGKSSLLSEKLGNAHICKVCFMKVNGPFWKYRTYEKFDDATKQRTKALEKAKAQNFPESVLEGINTFFDGQIRGMMKCDGCGLTVQTLHPIGAGKLCKKCFSKIDKDGWNKKKCDFEDNTEVEEVRNKTLQIARKQQFPPIIIEGINKHFESMIEQGLFCSIDGDEEQILRVYDTHCILITNEDFDINEASKRYGAARKNSQPGENLISSNTVVKAARSFMTGGIVKAGITLATDAVASTVINRIPIKEEFTVHQGSYRIEYRDIGHVEYKNVSDEEDAVGYIRFQNAYSQDRSDDIVFLFSSKEKKAKEACRFISDKIREAHTIPTQLKEVPVSVRQAPMVDPIEQTKKFKELLDMGILTQEEFNAKKKELLNL